MGPLQIGQMISLIYQPLPSLQFKQSDSYLYLKDRMEHVGKKSTKSIDEYRHNIKLLKYHLKKEQKINETLKYKDSKKNKKESVVREAKGQERHALYAMLDIVNALNSKLKDMGLVLGDLFRMADSSYEGEITKEQFMVTVAKLKANLDEGQINQMFYAIDSNLNGMLSSDQYNEFLAAHGGTQSKEATIFQRQTAEKFVALLKKKNIKADELVRKLLNPIPLEDMNAQLKKLNLNVNQIMILFKMWDPSLSGFIKHQVYIKSMENVRQKDEKQIQNEKYQKGIKELCVIFRDRKINPIDIFETSDVDGSEGITIFELQQGFKKLMPEETSYQIKKWVNLININNDNDITKEEFISAIRSFYSLQQIQKFSGEYDKMHPKLKKALAEEEIPTQKVINQLSIYIEDNGLTKTEVFHLIDINHNGLIDKAQLLEGLKKLGISIGFIGKVLAVFDRDASGEIGLDEWLSILGEDLQMESIEEPSEIIQKERAEKPVGEKAKNQKKKEKQEKKVEKPKQVKKEPPKQKQAAKPKEINKSKQPEKKDLSKSKQPEKKELSKSKQPEKKDVSVKKIETQSKKPPLKKMDESKKSIAQKPKVEEKKPLKDQDKNKKTEPIKEKPKQMKKQSKIVSKQSKKEPEPFQQVADEESNNFNQLQQTYSEQEISTQEIQKEVGETYAKSPKKVSEMFLKSSKNRKKGLNERQLAQFITDLKIKSQCGDKHIKKIFEDNCSNNGLITTQWFDKLKETYELTINEESEHEEEIKKKPSKKEQTENLPKIKGNVIESKIPTPKVQPQKQQNEDNEDDGYNESFQNNESSFVKKQVAQSKKEIGKQEKRGKEHENFQQLQEHTLQPQTISDEGYKLKKFIKCDEQLQLLEEKYQPQANSIKKNKKIFQDKAFPTNLASLTHLPPNQSQIPNVTLLKWKHYKEIYKNPQLFKNSISPNDIKQGTLGDCYFLCSLAALAEYKNLIERLFEYYDVDNGYFLVWTCIDGQWQLIELDGYVPVSPTADKPAFSHGEDEQLWVLLLQKAYAKAYGNYEKINGGQPYEAIKDLTGAPGQSFCHTKEDIKIEDIWKKLEFANKQQFIMTCGTDVDKQGNIKMDGHSQSVTNEGLVLGHAYSILDIRTYKNQRLIQLRNPWGETQWKGQWSDKSSKWTEQAKKELGYTSLAEDGIFWMPFQAYFSKYNTTAINYLQPSYHYESTVKKGMKSIVLKIAENSFKHGFVMVTQKDHRKDGLPPNTPYNMNHLIALQYKKGKIVREISNQKYLYQREGSIQITSNPGSSVIILVNLEKKTDVMLCSYSESKFQFQTDEASESMMQYIEDIATMQERAKNVQETPNLFKTWMSSVGQYAFLVFKSVAKKPIGFQVQLSNPKNIELIPKTNKAVMKLKPGQVKCIKGRILSLKDPYSFGPLQFSFDE